MRSVTDDTLRDQRTVGKETYRVGSCPRLIGYGGGRGVYKSTRSEPRQMEQIAQLHAAVTLPPEKRAPGTQ
jgi:hypothetical protein